MLVKRNYKANELEQMNTQELIGIIQRQSRAISVLKEHTELLIDDMRRFANVKTYNVERANDTVKALKDEVPVL